MHGRYLLLYARSPDLADLVARACLAEGLVPIAKGAHIALLTDCKTPFLEVAKETVWLIGSLFTGRDAVRPGWGGGRSRSPAKIFSDLISHHWGQYIAIALRADGVEILRDPSGTIPCYYSFGPGFLAASSDASLLSAAALRTPVLDWSRVGHFLCIGDAPDPATALAGVSELFPGFRLECSGDEVITSIVWNPWDHVAPDTTAGTVEEAEALHDRIVAATSALASFYDHVIARVSGGLDSSIVAAALARGEIGLSLLTMIADGLGDERRYAQSLAEHLGLALHEAHYAIDQVDIGSATAPAMPRPWGRHVGKAIGRLCGEHDHFGADVAIMQGTGGDAVFCFLHSSRPALDRLAQEGIGRGLLSTIIDIAGMNGATISEVLRSMAVRYMRPRATYSLPVNDLFLASDREKPQHYVHPWLVVPSAGLPGKLAHIGNILGSLRVVEGCQRLLPAPLILPLLSQPVMEACLAIPSWHWCADGQDRAVARAAFKKDLPSLIIDRQSKGTPDAFAAQFADHHRPILRERLLGGLLAQHGLLDRPRIEQALIDPRPLSTEYFLRLLQLSDAECWVRGWWP